MVATTVVDDVLAQGVATGVTPGVVAIAADADGMFFSGAVGVADVASSRAMALDTVFAIASMTKPVTAVAALQLVEQGRVSLDEPLGARLPALAAIPILDGFDDAGVPRYRPQQRPITLRHLLTHTAGFGYPLWNADLQRLQRQNGVAFPPLEAPLVFDAGDRWEYGINIDWAGYLVEVISGQTLEDYMREHIFAPLGMVDTSFIVGSALRRRLATRYQRQPDGSLQPIDVVIPARPAFFNGGGGLYSTGPDYARFLRMLLGGGQLDGARILRPATVAAMAENQISDLTVCDLPTCNPAMSNPVALYPGMVKRWGLGGMITTEAIPGGRSEGSWTWAGISNTYFWFDPGRSMVGMLLTQILPFCDGPVLDLLNAFERAVYASR